MSTKRLLLFSYHFPPSTAVGGVRWQQFARFLVEHGWQLDVVCLDARDLGTRDDTRLASLPQDVRMFGVPDPEPLISSIPRAAWRMLRRARPSAGSTSAGAIARSDLGSSGGSRAASRAFWSLMDFVRGGAWAMRAATVGHRLSWSRNYAVVASSGPPHMAHVAALSVSKRARLPMISDFRDPWSLVERVPEHIASPVWFALARRFERRVVEGSQVVAMNTDRSRVHMQARYPAHADRIVTIRNGSDEGALPQAAGGSRFSVRFAGSIYLDRNPRLVFRAAARVIRELSLTPGDFAFEFIGDVERFGGITLQEIADDEGIAGFVQTGPGRPHQDAMSFLAGGSMLLSLPQDSHAAIPAKIYEYVRFPAWLLVLAERDSSTAMLLQNTDADVVEPSDVDSMATAIRLRYQAFRRGEHPRAINADGRFDRRRQASVLLQHLERLVQR